MRFDFVFSYWIFVWYLLYISKFTSFSPKFAICVGILENIVLLSFMILNCSNKRTIFYFVFINTIIKLIPFYTLRKETVTLKDINPMLVLFAVYLVWIFVNKQNVYKMSYESLIHNRDDMPFLSLVSFIKRKTGWKFL
jgi:hypothetical protein